MELSSGKRISNAVEDMAQELISQFGQVSADRGNFETQWQEISELCFPMDSRSFQGEWINKGEKRTQRQYDSTANTALNRFMAILDSLLTPANSKWHTMSTDDPVLNRNRQVREYYDTVTNILFRERYRATANFTEQNQHVWLSLGAYGTGGLYVDQLWGQKGLRYKFIPLGNLYITENHQGVVDKVFRKYRMTARQAMQKWKEKCPDFIADMAKTSPETRFEFLHCVGPRENFDPGRKDYRGMPFYSYDISIQGGQMVDIGGYHTFPYPVARYMQSLEEEYGRSPAMDVLPAIKTLNEEKKALLKQAHRVLDPIYLTYDDGVLDTMSAMPGSMVAGGVSANGQPLVHTLPTGNVQIGKDLMDDERNDIKDAFLTSLFQILVETPEMTATEVMERVKEKGILIAPSIGRQESYLHKTIAREFDLLNRQGVMPPMPTILKEARGEYKIRFESPLAKMRRAEEAAGLMRMLENSIQIAQAAADPSILQFYNWDVIMPEMAEIQGLPQRWMNTLDKVQALRQASAQQQQTQNMIQAGPAAAAIMKASKG